MLKRRDFMNLTLATGASVAALSSAQAASRSAATDTNALTAEIRDTLKTYQDLWDLQDAPRLEELWDTDSPPCYLAEEQDEWFHTWKQVHAYWTPSSITQGIRMRFNQVTAKWLSDDLAFATFRIKYDMKIRPMPKPIGGDTRASAVFRKKPEGWRLTAWTEAPQSPITYMRKLYEMNVMPGADDFYPVTAKPKE